MRTNTVRECLHSLRMEDTLTHLLLNETISSAQVTGSAVTVQVPPAMYGAVLRYCSCLLHPDLKYAEGFIRFGHEIPKCRPEEARVFGAKVVEGPCWKVLLTPAEEWAPPVEFTPSRTKTRRFVSRGKAIVRY